MLIFAWPKILLKKIQIERNDKIERLEVLFARNPILYEEKKGWKALEETNFVI